jgi:hypothetical protein
VLRQGAVEQPGQPGCGRAAVGTPALQLELVEDLLEDEAAEAGGAGAAPEEAILRRLSRAGQADPQRTGSQRSMRLPGLRMVFSR